MLPRNLSVNNFLKIVTVDNLFALLRLVSYTTSRYKKEGTSISRFGPDRDGCFPTNGCQSPEHFLRSIQCTEVGCQVGGELLPGGLSQEWRSEQFSQLEHGLCSLNYPRAYGGDQSGRGSRHGVVGFSRCLQGVS